MSLPPLPYGIAAPAPPEPPATKRGFGTGAGRKVGQKDRVTLALKEAILLAAEEVGDALADAAAEKGETRTGGLAGYLTMVATTDVKAFAGLLGKVLPMTIAGLGDKGALEVVFRTVYEETAPKPAP